MEETGKPWSIRCNCRKGAEFCAVVLTHHHFGLSLLAWCVRSLFAKCKGSEQIVVILLL